MKPAPFAYHRPRTVEEATSTLGAADAKVLAGGQSLIPLMSMRLAAPAALVDLTYVDGLDAIEVDEVAVRVGALTRHATLEDDTAAYAANPLLRNATQHVAHPTIRNRGTTLGSIVHADPAAEMPAVLMLLGGSVDAVSAARGMRTIAAADLFLGPLESALEPDELAVAASFPHPPAGSGSCWVEIARRHGDYALVGVGAIVTLDSALSVTAAKVSLISVAGTPVLVDVAQAVAGTTYDAVDWSATVSTVDAAIDPETDIHATADYRRQLAHVLTTRALSAAAHEAVDSAAA